MSFAMRVCKQCRASVHVQQSDCRNSASIVAAIEAALALDPRLAPLARWLARRLWALWAPSFRLLGEGAGRGSSALSSCCAVSVYVSSTAEGVILNESFRMAPSPVYDSSIEGQSTPDTHPVGGGYQEAIEWCSYLYLVIPVPNALFPSFRAISVVRVPRHARRSLSASFRLVHVPRHEAASFPLCAFREAVARSRVSPVVRFPRAAARARAFQVADKPLKGTRLDYAFATAIGAKLLDQRLARLWPWRR